MSQPLVTIDPVRQANELARARQAEAMQAEWHRAWLGVFGQCVVMSLLGYALFGVSFAVRSGETSSLIVATSFCVAYVLPFFRLLVFFVKHSDQF